MASGITLNSTNNSEMNIVYQGTSGATRTVVVPDKDMTVAGLDDLKEIGVGQTWQDVTASRTSGTTYTNTTGKPIMVLMAWTGTTNTVCAVNVGGLSLDVAGTYNLSGVYVRDGFSIIVPNNTSYIITNTGGTITKWFELR